MSRCDLNLWPLNLELLRHFARHALKLHTKLEGNRIIHRRVIDDLARFRVHYRVGQNWQVSLRSGWTQLHQTWQGHRAMIAALHLFQISDILLHFQTPWLKIEWCFNRRQISTFWPPVEIRGGVHEISIPIVEALPTAEPPNYIWWPSTAQLLSSLDWS